MLAVDCNGGNQSSGSGVPLLGAQKRAGAQAELIAVMRDQRILTRIRRRMREIIEACVWGIFCCGREGGIDPDASVVGETADHLRRCWRCRNRGVTRRLNTRREAGR